MVCRVCEPLRPRSSYRWHEMQRFSQRVRRGRGAETVVVASRGCPLQTSRSTSSRSSLAPPSVRPGTVAKVGRDRTAALGGARLATVVAPAGYGKTTLFARWAESEPRAFAWVSLDGRDDDDPRVFLRYIAAALFGAGRSRRTSWGAVRPGGGRLDDERAGCRGAHRAIRAADRARARRPPPRQQRSLSRRPGGARPVRSGGLADRGHEPRGAGSSRSAAGARRGGCTRSVSRTSDWTSRRPGCCWRRSTSSSTRASSPS